MSNNERNTLAFKEAIAALQVADHAKQVRIDQLHTALLSMSERMTSLERMIVSSKAASVGHGSSVKP